MVIRSFYRHWMRKRYRFVFKLRKIVSPAGRTAQVPESPEQIHAARAGYPCYSSSRSLAPTPSSPSLSPGFRRGQSTPDRQPQPIQPSSWLRNAVSMRIRLSSSSLHEEEIFFQSFLLIAWSSEKAPKASLTVLSGSPILCATLIIPTVRNTSRR